MSNDRKLEVILMINALRNIFGDDLDIILMKGFGINVKKIKRISYLYNQYYALKHFYETEVDNHRKRVRKYLHYEKVVGRSKSNLNVTKISDLISIRDWEGIVKENINHKWSDGIGLISNKGEKNVNFVKAF